MDVHPRDARRAESLSVDGDQVSPESRYVIDASVGVKWLLCDEEDLTAADELLHRCDRAEIALFAPRQMTVEVSNALRKAVLNQRLSTEDAERALGRWLQGFQTRLSLAENEDLLPLALPRSLELGVTLFDALYIVLAEEIEATLVVADLRLLRSSAAHLSFLQALQDANASD